MGNKTLNTYFVFKELWDLGEQNSHFKHFSPNMASGCIDPTICSHLLAIGLWPEHNVTRLSIRHERGPFFMPSLSEPRSRQVHEQQVSLHEFSFHPIGRSSVEAWCWHGFQVSFCLLLAV